MRKKVKMFKVFHHLGTPMANGVFDTWEQAAEAIVNTGNKDEYYVVEVYAVGEK